MPTALGSAPVTLPNNIAPAVSSSVAFGPPPAGAVVFRAVVAGAGAGVFEVEPFTGPYPAESVGGGFRNPRIDRAGNMTARFP